MRVPEGALEIVRRLKEAGHEAFLAGGCVRDRLMGREPGDWDVATGAEAGEVQALFARTVPVGAQFGVVRVLLDDGEYEVARFRRDEAYEDGRRPRAVHPAGAREDAQRRDFTINGMFYDPFADRIIDFVGGEADIRAEILRAIGDPGTRFGEDHLRMLRAVRFAARFGFEIEAETFGALRKCAPLVRKTSPERVREELTAMLTGPHPERAFALLMDAGLLAEVLPEVAETKGVPQPPEYHPEGEVWTHVLLTLRELRAPSPALAWGALLHDVGKPPTLTEPDRIRFNGHAEAGARMGGEICQRLSMGNREAERVRDLVSNHMRFMNVMKMRPARLKRFLREDYLHELMELHRADCKASHGDLVTYRFCLEKLAQFEAEEEAAGLRPLPLLDGHALAGMGFTPGPIFKEILDALEDEQLEGRVRTRPEAEAFVEKKFGDQAPQTGK